MAVLVHELVMFFNPIQALDAIHKPQQAHLGEIQEKKVFFFFSLTK